MKRLKLFKLVIVRKWQRFLRDHYIKIRRGINFVKHTYVIKVKKGKIKYYLVIIETFDGRKLRFNLGRHLDRDCTVQELKISIKDCIYV